MSYTVISRCCITLHDVSTQPKDKAISRLIKKHLPNVCPKINRGDTRYKNLKKVYKRIYITFDKPESVDELMKHRSDLRLDGELLRITRTLPKMYPLYDRCVTGLKIKIHQSDNGNTSIGKLNERDLRRYFEHFGIICSCQWTDQDQTEALFIFADFDSVDKIILCNVSPEIKGVKVDLEKTRTAKDYITYERRYVIHVTNLPVRVTSEEISEIFQVPNDVILLHPCFRIEQTHLVSGRSSSEAWITNINDEKTAQTLAEKKTDIFLRTNKIHCEHMLELINEDELCEHFQKGRCQYTMDTCHYKHFTCSEPVTCNDQYCWFGHTNERTTISANRPKYRSENARYRIKFSNLPSNITHNDLMTQLKIHSKYSRQLILQPVEEGSDSPRMAYLIRQSLENNLRLQIAKWHNMFSSLPTAQKIQYQLEINQDLFEWNDLIDVTPSIDNSRCASPILTTHSAHSDRSKRAAWHPSAASTCSWRQSVSKKKHTSGQVQIAKPVPIYHSDSAKNKQIINTLKSKSVSGMRQPPADLSSLSTQWRWTNEMIPNDQIDRDRLYWVNAESNNERNVVIKIYLPKTDRTARVRAQHEQVALGQLTELPCVPKLFNSNVDTSNNNQSNKEFWNIMKLIDGERLSDYIKCNKVDLREALQITRQLLSIIKQIHIRNVIHRDIQPKNILIGRQYNMMLISFSSAWINGAQQVPSNEDFDDQLGNTFYRMPQFERRPTESEQNKDNQQLQQFRHSPTINTTGICAILFWLITGHEPKESQDIWGHPPHKLRDNPKLIEKKIIEVTAFQMEMKIHEHLQKHLMFTFDRSFSEPNQQWSVIELDYQLQFMLALIDGDKEGISYFPALLPNINDNISLPIIPFGDPFVYVVSLIHHLKNQFATRYSKCVRWSNVEKNRWCSQDGRIEHNDLLIFSYQTKNLSIDTQWNVKLLKEQQFSICIKAKDNDKIDIELPLGVWRIDEQTNDFIVHLNSFEIDMKILINILCQSNAF